MRVKFDGPREILCRPVMFALIVQRNSPVVECVSISGIQLDRFRVIIDRPVAIALILSCHPAIEIGLGDGIEFDRFAEIGYGSIVVSLAPADQAAVEIGGSVVPVEFDGPAKIRHRPVQITRF